MTGTRALSQLTVQWYLFALAGGATHLLLNGLGIGSIVVAALTTALSLGITYWISEGLKGRKQWLRVLLIGLAGLVAAFGVMGMWQLGAVFFATWRFAVFVTIVWTGAVVAMQLQSIRVLLSRPVARYFR